jgi:hypothetical protein
MKSDLLGQGGRISGKFWLGFALAMGLSLPSFGQTFGQISGVIYESIGAIVPAATITVTNPQTNFTRALASNWQLKSQPAVGAVDENIIHAAAFKDVPLAAKFLIDQGAKIRLHETSDLNMNTH